MITQNLCMLYGPVTFGTYILLTTFELKLLKCFLVYNVFIIYYAVYSIRNKPFMYRIFFYTFLLIWNTWALFYFGYNDFKD